MTTGVYLNFIELQNCFIYKISC